MCLIKKQDMIVFHIQLSRDYIPSYSDQDRSLDEFSINEIHRFGLNFNNTKELGIKMVSKF